MYGGSACGALVVSRTLSTADTSGIKEVPIGVARDFTRHRRQGFSMMEKSSASHVSILGQDLCCRVCVRTSLFGVNETSGGAVSASKKNTLAAVVKQEAGGVECDGVAQVMRRPW